MTRDTRVQLWAGLVLAGCLAASAVLATQMTVIAGRARMTYTDRAEDTDRPEVSIGIAMGAFRGVFVNALWMRANDLKQEGKFYECIELARAITRLQPRFPQVWVFHAWNLAYNISVQTQTPDERWNWVNQGVAILREEGIPANPNSLLLHKELGWIFLHKIQGFTDDANLYYKRRLAEEWTDVLGAPPPRTRDDRSTKKVIEKHVAWLKSITDAPITREEMIRAYPESERLFATIEGELGLSMDTRADRMNFLHRYEMFNAFRKSSRRYIYDRSAGPKTKALIAMCENPAFEKALPVFVSHVRRRVLIEDYKMEPDRMIRYTEKYGPLDWRHGASHSLYWAARGVEEALEIANMKGVNKGDFDFVNTDRVVAQSIQQLFRTGELYFDYKASVANQYSIYQGINNEHFAESYGKLLDEMRMRSLVREGATGRLVNIDQLSAERGNSRLSEGYSNFMKEVVIMYYRRGDRMEAERWLKQLRTFKDQNLNDIEENIRKYSDLDLFVEGEIADSATRPDIAINQISSALISAFATGLLGRDAELFQKQYDFARRWHYYYMDQQARRNAVARDAARMAQLDEDWEFFAGTMFLQFMQSAGMGEEAGYNEDAQAIYFSAPDELRVWVYDALVESYKPQIDAEAKIGGKPFDELFPEPEGLQKHREYLARELEKRRKQSTNVERQ